MLSKKDFFAACLPEHEGNLSAEFDFSKPMNEKEAATHFKKHQQLLARLQEEFYSRYLIEWKKMLKS